MKNWIPQVSKTLREGEGMSACDATGCGGQCKLCCPQQTPETQEAATRLRRLLNGEPIEAVYSNYETGAIAEDVKVLWPTFDPTESPKVPNTGTVVQALQVAASRPARCTEYVELEGGIKVIRRPDGSWVVITEAGRQTMMPNASTTMVAGVPRCDDCGAPAKEVDCPSCGGTGDEGRPDRAKACGRCDGQGKIMAFNDDLEKDVGRMKGQITEAISILTSGSDYEKMHVVSILREGLA